MRSGRTRQLDRMNTQCPVTGLAIISKPHWHFLNHADHYTTSIRRIGKNILFAEVDASSPITLGIFEKKTVRRVIEDSGLVNKPIYCIWNLEKVQAITHRYKKGIADFLYNPPPPLKAVVFYNIRPEFINTVEIFRAICPLSMKVAFTEGYEQAITMTQDMIADGAAFYEPEQEDELKNRFLAATARIGWLNLLSQPVFLPERDHDCYPYFSALYHLQKDFAEEYAAYSEKAESFERHMQVSAEQIKTETASIKSEMEHMMAAFKQEKALLEKNLLQIKHESRSTAIMLPFKGAQLEETIQQTLQLPISTEQKKQIIDVCEKLLEAEKNRTKTDIPLTATDSAFLSLLQRKHPGLSNRELKLCLFIKMNFDTEEIADYYSITKRGIESARYRLHKKIGLQKNQSLKNYLTSLTKDLVSFSIRQH